MFIDELATVRPAGAKNLQRVIFAIAIPFARDSVGRCKREQLSFGGVRDNGSIRFIPVVVVPQNFSRDPKRSGSWWSKQTMSASRK
jgi:hypothetical protein